MPKYLWVKWEAVDGGPRCKRFPFLYKVSRRIEPHARGEGFMIALREGTGRGTMGAFELKLSEGADPEAAAKAFVDAEGGILTEFWEEVEHE